MTYYRGGLSAFGRRVRGSGLGADVTLIEPSLEQGWTAEDARMLDILGSKGTNSPEGQALIKDIEAKFGAGNWYPEWTRLQDYYTQKYLAAKSDAQRLATLQATTTQDAAKMDPTQTYLPAGSVPYSIHDINAFQAMSVEEQAAFLMGFADIQAASYFAMVAGVKPGVLELIPPPLGNKGAYMGADGKLYNSPEDAAKYGGGLNLPGTVVSVTTSSGEVLTPKPGEALPGSEVFGPGYGTTTVPQWQAPTAPAPITNPYPTAATPTDGSTEGGVPAPAPVTPPPVIIETARPSGTLTPTTPTASGGGGTFTTTPKAPKPSAGGGDYGDGTGTGPAPATAGVPGGALGVLAVLGIGLALLARGKK